MYFPLLSSLDVLYVSMECWVIHKRRDSVFLFLLFTVPLTTYTLLKTPMEMHSH